MSEFFIRRPIFAIVISILMVVLGLIVLMGIPVSQYPDITPPMVQVYAAYSGANAVNVEQAVSTPIEQQVNGVEDMLYMRSINASDGSANIQVSFNVGTDLDKANMLTQNKVSQANPFLPPEVLNSGIIVKKSLTFPLMLVSLYSPGNTYDKDFLINYAFINAVDELKRTEGVGDVSILGGTQYGMRIWLKPERLASYDMTVQEVMSAVKSQNAIQPGGSFGGEPSTLGTQFTYSAQLQSRLVTEEQFGEIIIKSDQRGAIVRLKDVARIELGSENYMSESRLNGNPAATIAVYQIPGSNGLTVAESVRKKMDKLKESFPTDMGIAYPLDTTLAVEAGIEEILHTLFEAVLLVILVVFIFLQNWRATLIPLLTVPVSLIGTFIFFPLMGFSVNVLSLLGMVLAIGLVVDDAIVVVEAVMHHMQHGLSPKEATRKAMKEVGGPVVAIAIILAAVFIPVALTGGITGRLYQQFAITIAISVLLSAFNALTLSPALASIILKPSKPGNGLLSRFFGAFNRFFDRLTERYGKITGFFARKLVVMLLLLGGIIFLAAGLMKSVPGGFVPEEDQGYLICAIQLPDASSLQRTDQISRKVESLLKNVKPVKSYTVVNGNNILTSAISSNTATVFIELKPWDERQRTALEIADNLNKLFVKEITEATVIAVGPPPIPGLGSSGGFTMELQDRGGNTPQYLAEQTQRFVTAASQRPEISKIYSLYRANVPQKSIQVDKEKVQKLGVNLAEVNSTIGVLLGGTFVNNLNQFGRQYKTFLMADSEYRMRPEDLSLFFVRDKSGNMVPVGTFVTVTDTSGPQFTNHFNIYRAAEISGTPAPGYSSGQALDALEEVAAQTLPADMSYQWSNISYQEKASAGKSGTVFVMALLFVFLILAAQYESWSLPFSVLLGTPWAVMGAFLGLYICRFFSEAYVNNVFAQIGLVMLIGLNAKNAILIVEFAKMKSEEGIDALTAALDAAKLRLRPILMTSLAFILGVIPLITATGAGSQSRKVMGMAVFSGMIVATIIGLLLIPAMYVLINKISGRKSSKSDVINPTEGTAH
ncbi:MAG: efflux RND transporter permease subunit [Bacteroidota bacterium]